MYNNLQELIAAYQSGALDKEESPLIIDGDSTVVYAEGLLGADPYGKVFDGGDSEHLLKEALDLLGVPWQEA